MEENNHMTPQPNNSGGAGGKGSMYAGIIVAIIILAAIAYFATRNSNNSQVSDNNSPTLSDQPVGESNPASLPITNTTDQTSTTAPVTTPPAPSSPNAPSKNTTPPVTAVKSFTVIGSNFKFAPSEIRVKKGDTVKITFQSNGFHDFVIDQLNVQSNQISDGQTDTVTFVASKAGTFKYYCSVEDHRQLGMVGNLIVE